MRTLKSASAIPALESKPTSFLTSSKGSGKPTLRGHARTGGWGSASPSSGILWSPTAEPSAPKAPATSRVQRLSRAFPCGPLHALQKPLLRLEFQHDPDLGENAIESPFPNGCSGEAAEDLRYSRDEPDSARLAILRDLNVDHNFAGQFLVEQIGRVI